MSLCKQVCLITLCICGLITVAALSWAIAIGIGVLTALATKTWADSSFCSARLDPVSFIFVCALEGLITVGACLGLLVIVFLLYKLFVWLGYKLKRHWHSDLKYLDLQV